MVYSNSTCSQEKNVMYFYDFLYSGMISSRPNYLYISAIAIYLAEVTVIEIISNFD